MGEKLKRFRDLKLLWQNTCNFTFIGYHSNISVTVSVSLVTAFLKFQDKVFCLPTWDQGTRPVSPGWRSPQESSSIATNTRTPPPSPTHTAIHTLGSGRHELAVRSQLLSPSPVWSESPAGSDEGLTAASLGEEEICREKGRAGEGKPSEESPAATRPTNPSGSNF